jgi:hypothetical protein
MRGWLAALIAGPDGAVDEAALFVCSLGLMTIASWGTLTIIAIYMAITTGHFAMMEFAQASALLLGAGGTTAGIIEAFIGTRNRLNKQG